MLSLDNAAPYLLARQLIDPDWIISGSLTVRSVAMRNGNLLLEGPGGAGLLIKQPADQEPLSRETLHREAAFYRFCQGDPTAAPVAEIVPQLVDFDANGTVLAINLIPDAVTLSEFLEPKADQRLAIEVVASAGRALATVHHTFRIPNLPESPDLNCLSGAAPWGFSLHRPTPQVLSGLSLANAELIRILQADDASVRELDALQSAWRADTVIHGDLRPSNVLVKKKRTDGGSQVWIIDWEMVQLGDPAWDLAGALEAFTRAWVASIPMTAGLSIDERAARAKFPFETVQALCRSVWESYSGAMECDRAFEARPLLERAVRLLGVRMIQSAYEISIDLTDLHPQSVILLQLASNVLLGSERALAQILGIHGSAAGQ